MNSLDIGVMVKEQNNIKTFFTKNGVLENAVAKNLSTLFRVNTQNQQGEVIKSADFNSGLVIETFTVATTTTVATSTKINSKANCGNYISRCSNSSNYCTNNVSSGCTNKTSDVTDYTLQKIISVLDAFWKKLRRLFSKIKHKLA